MRQKRGYMERLIQEEARRARPVGVRDGMVAENWRRASLS
jgi:hypothetical protein